MPGKPLDNADLTSLRKYRIALHRQQIESGQDYWKKKDQYPSASKLGARIGVKKSTIWRYERYMPGLIRRRRRKEVPTIDGNKLTPQEKLRGGDIIYRGAEKLLCFPLPSSRCLIPSA